jgi:hypothetical protein
LSDRTPSTVIFSTLISTVDKYVENEKKETLASGTSRRLSGIRPADEEAPTMTIPDSLCVGCGKPIDPKLGPPIHDDGLGGFLCSSCCERIAEAVRRLQRLANDPSLSQRRRDEIKAIVRECLAEFWQ